MWFSLLFHQIWAKWFLVWVRFTAWAPAEIFCATIFFIGFCSARVREFCRPDLDFHFKFSSARCSIWFLVVFAALASFSSSPPVDLLHPLPAVAVLFASSIKRADSFALLLSVGSTIVSAHLDFACHSLLSFCSISSCEQVPLKALDRAPVMISWLDWFFAASPPKFDFPAWAQFLTTDFSWALVASVSASRRVLLWIHWLVCGPGLGL
jgi:hypothetical protein